MSCHQLVTSTFIVSSITAQINMFCESVNKGWPYPGGIRGKGASGMVAGRAGMHCHNFGVVFSLDSIQLA